AVEDTQPLDAVDIGKNRGSNGHGAGPDQAADSGYRVQLPAGYHQQQADESRTADKIYECQHVPAGYGVRNPPEQHGSRNGDKADCADTQCTGCTVEAVINQHRNAVNPKQSHAETVGHQAQRDFPEGRGEQSSAGAETADLVATLVGLIAGSRCRIGLYR